MWSYVLAFIVFAAVFGAFDLVWLSTAFRTVYEPSIGPLLAERVRPVPALLFYLTYVGGVTFFVLTPAAGGDWRAAALRGAIFGLVAYGAYDLTNQATLRVWPVRLTLIDISWGAVATSAAAALTTILLHRLAKP